jgi:lincosamide and streptogramin A transport system ATP-binding/permease protein
VEVGQIMSMIKVENLTFSYPGSFDNIFENVSLQMDTDWKLGKVLIAGSLCQEAHLYLWDEPLNFIDIYSRLQIEDLIQQFQPTMIFVEHDAAFRDKIETDVIEL